MADLLYLFYWLIFSFIMIVSPFVITMIIMDYCKDNFKAKISLLGFLPISFFLIIYTLQISFLPIFSFYYFYGTTSNDDLWDFKKILLYFYLSIFVTITYGLIHYFSRRFQKNEKIEISTKSDKVVAEVIKKASDEVIPILDRADD